MTFRRSVHSFDGGNEVGSGWRAEFPLFEGSGNEDGWAGASTLEVAVLLSFKPKQCED